jgi:hypothetical protein
MLTLPTPARLYLKRGQRLEPKPCAACGRPFTWQRRWVGPGETLIPRCSACRGRHERRGRA